MGTCRDTDSGVRSTTCITSSTRFAYSRILNRSPKRLVYYHCIANSLSLIFYTSPSSSPYSFYIISNPMSRSQRQSPTRYSLLEGIDYDDEIDIEKAPPKSHERKRRSSLYYYILILLIGTSCLALGFASGALVKNHENHIDPAPSSSQCTDPSIRREWRSLSRSEKKDYIDAVQCLRTTPSKLGLNQSLYDDFPYVHNRVGAYCMTSIYLYQTSTSNANHIINPKPTVPPPFSHGIDTSSTPTNKH